MIRICDTKAQNRLPEIQYAMQEVVNSGQYIKGEYVEAFERVFAFYNRVDYCLGVNSGSDALFLALLACGVGAGDEVITTASSYHATSDAIVRTGAKPVFADIVNDGTNLIDETKLEALRTEKTKAVIPVHLHGYVCNIEKIVDWANSYRIKVIEDCAQATGANAFKSQEPDLYNVNQKIQTGKVGTFGDVGCFSFYPTKNLGAIGDGGAIITNNPEIHEKARELAAHGCRVKNDPYTLGYNSRLDALQAAILTVKLDYLEEQNEIRRKIAGAYHELLSEMNTVIYDFKLPPLLSNSVYHHYILKFQTSSMRDKLQTWLQTQGIESLAYYPKPLNKIEHYRSDNVCPVAEKNSQTNLGIPMHPFLTKVEIEYIVKKIKLGIEKIINV